MSEAGVAVMGGAATAPSPATELAEGGSWRSTGGGLTGICRIRVSTRTGIGGGSGSRRGVVCSHIKREGHSQHRGGGRGRRCGFISSLA